MFFHACLFKLQDIEFRFIGADEDRVAAHGEEIAGFKVRDFGIEDFLARGTVIDEHIIGGAGLDDIILRHGPVGGIVLQAVVAGEKFALCGQSLISGIGK